MTLATSLTPSRLKLPGVYQFNVEFVIESRRKMIDFSESLNKLFVDVNSWTELRIRVDNPLVADRRPTGNKTRHSQGFCHELRTI